MDQAPPDRDAAQPFVDLAALLGLAGILGGSLILAPTDLGFDRGAAVAALAAWIPATIGPGILVLLAAAAEVGAGAVVGRLLRRRPFEHLDEAVLQGFALAVVKDAVVLGVLGGSGLFRQPLLLGLDAAILGVGLALGRPFAVRGLVPRLRTVSLLEVLIVVAWSAPVLLQLASPVVPFIDILPNHVAPAEHLRTFGSLGHLTDTQSPIYGPSRIFLGYTSLLGAISTIVNLPAGAAIAGFILPETLVVAIAVRRFAIAVGGPRIGPWALLAFATTTSLARLGDARATVVVLPLAAWVLASVADRLRVTAATSDREGDASMSPSSPPPPSSPPDPRDAADGGGDPPLLPQPVVVGLGLGAAMLMHPVIGFLAALAVLVVVLARRAAADVGVPALGTAAVMALPQAVTMLGIPLPPVALALAIVAAAGVGVLLAGSAAAPVRAAIVALGRVTAVALGLGGVVLAGPLVQAAIAGADPILTVIEVTLVAAVIAIALGTPAARSPVVWAALAAGFAVATFTQLVPQHVSLLADALRFELPKTLQYWVPVFVAVLAAAGLDGLLHHPRLAPAAGGLAVVAFAITMALPVRTTPIDAFYLGEHRLSETLSIALRWVQAGFWQGYPDARYVVDAPRQDLLDLVRADIVRGTIGPDTPILHVAGSFQQWAATPLGVFDGVTETDVTPDAEVSIHTVGGRLHPLADLEPLLASGAYPYVVLEPDPNHLPPDVEARILAAGYIREAGDAEGTIYRRAG